MSEITPSTMFSAWIALAYQEQTARQFMDQLEANPNASEKEIQEACLNYKNITIAMWEFDFHLYNDYHISVHSFDLGFRVPKIGKEDMIPRLQKQEAEK